MVKWAQTIELAICPIYVRVTIKNSYVTIKWVEWAQPIDCSEITIFKVIMVSMNSYIRHCSMVICKIRKVILKFAFPKVSLSCTKFIKSTIPITKYTRHVKVTMFIVV